MQSLNKVTIITPNGPITLIKFGFEYLHWNCQSDVNNLVFSCFYREANCCSSLWLLMSTTRGCNESVHVPNAIDFIMSLFKILHCA